ncbi:MAG TPA: hypothetical protein VMI75_32185 [Polyangiaceae bacterium]|nr:hypothetical protein [Polyangiaceae bacterium]
MLTVSAWYYHNHTVMGMWTSSAVRYQVLNPVRALDLARGLVESWYAGRPPYKIELSDGDTTWSADVATLQGERAARQQRRDHGL